MKNGTNRAVLVRDLFSGDGPFEWLAEDYLAQRCSRCRIPTDDDVRFHDNGFLCPPCWALFHS